RIALPVSLIVVVITETIGDSVGLGYYITIWSTRFTFANVYAAIVVIGICGLALDQALLLVRRRAVYWQRGAAGRRVAWRRCMSDVVLDSELRGSLDELARACRILEMEGHGDITLGHLSLRDPQSRGFWLKRNRIGLGEVLGADDFVLVDWDVRQLAGSGGRQRAGSGGRHSEWPIHSEILRRRPDVQVVAHTHPFHACVFAASLDPLLPFTLDADYFIEVPRHEADVALITTKEEGAALA